MQKKTQQFHFKLLFEVMNLPSISKNFVLKLKLLLPSLKNNYPFDSAFEASTFRFFIVFNKQSVCVKDEDVATV